MTATLADMVDSFALFDNWEDKYRYIIDLGDRLDPMDDALKTDDNLVRGCTSRVWMVGGVDDTGHLRFIADSDAKIVKGLVYLLVLAYQGKSVTEARTLDIDGVFDRLGLNQHLSPSRRNGFFSMAQRIKSLMATAD